MKTEMNFISRNVQLVFGCLTCFSKCPEAYCYSHTVVKVESFGPTPGPLAQSCLGKLSLVIAGHVSWMAVF